MGKTTTKKRTKTTAASVAAAAAAASEKENENEDEASSVSRPVAQGPMYTILSNAQLCETFHKRYVKELQQLYSKLDHDAFVFTFIKMFKTVLEAEESNEYGNTALSFCAKFATSFESEKTHPMLAATFHWLLTTISHSPHIRYRLCFYVNLLLKELGPCAALDDTQCDQILNYMLDRLTDISPSVRKQAVLAMQRLQMPDNPDDPVLCAYQFHLSSDPSSSVRQCVITCMGRNYYTVPSILERLWDIDDKVRRHTYLNMCSYPVRSYKVSQRLTLLEQGLNDSSESVRKTVIKYMLKQWIEAYQRNLIALTAALKLDSNEEELLRFRRVARQTLFVIFEQNDNEELLALLPLSEDCELHRCVPHEELSVEVALYWQCLSAYFQQTQADECELVLPELSVFCDYVGRFSQLPRPEMDKFAQMEFQGILLSLVEILEAYDLGDEIGRNNLKQLITQLLRDCPLDHKVIRVLVRCMEQLVTDAASRIQYFLEIIYEICELNTKQNDLVHDRTWINLINKLLDDLDPSLKTKVSELKVKIFELKEQEENFVREKEYIRAKAVSDDMNAMTKKYTDLIRPLLDKHGVLELPAQFKLPHQERVMKGLYISFYMVASKHVKTLNPSLCKLYTDFICRHFGSTETDTFEWAIKNGTTFSMLYESYTKEVFEVLINQFYKDNNIKLWETSAQCVFELMDHYGVDYFIDMNQTMNQQPKTKRRLLYTMQDFFDVEEDRNQSQNTEQNTDIIGMMSHFVERVVDKGIGLAIVRGLCRLVLRGQLNDRTDVLEKLLRRYFNPNTEAVISQALGMFFENIVELKLQGLLQPCLLPTVWTIINCSYDSPLHDVVPDNVTKFFIDLTLQDVSTPQSNIHNKIALSFLHYIHNYYTERKEMCRLLAKELTSLHLNVCNNAALKEEMQEVADKLIKCELEPRMVRNIIDFKGLLDGSFNPPLRKPAGNESDDECDSATVTTTSEYMQVTPAEAEERPAATTTTDKEKEKPAKEASKEPEKETAEATIITTVEAANTTTTEPVVANESGAAAVLTTFGHDNQVGIRFLRRSLHNSISQSDAESENLRSSQTPTREASPQQQAARQISKRNLGRPKVKERLEQAIARASKTPEKETTQSAALDSSDDNDSIDEVEEDQNTSEVIAASPTSATPNDKDMSRLRSRTTRSKAAGKATTTTPAATSKRKVLHLEMHTPLRNGRKRVLRKSPPAKSTSDQASPKPKSPQRKQQRLDAAAQLRKTPKRQSSIAAENAKSTASPTDSTSSVKENEVPAAVTPSRARPTRKSAANSPPSASSSNSSAASSSNSSTPLAKARKSTTITTRHSARQQRMTAMCMTRKRMSLEMNLSDGQLKLPTPKRPRPKTVASSSTLRSSSSSGRTETTTTPRRTRASTTTQAAGRTTRARRKSDIAKI